jgi:hypothetical protein
MYRHPLFEVYYLSLTCVYGRISVGRSAHTWGCVERHQIDGPRKAETLEGTTWQTTSTSGWQRCKFEVL